MRTTRLLLQDMLDAIAIVQQYLPGSEAAFIADAPIQSHILRHLAIIGEAASRLDKPIRDQNPQVPWRLMIDMRNIVVHVYFGINWHLVFETARTDVPLLKPQVEAMLAALPLAP